MESDVRQARITRLKAANEQGFIVIEELCDGPRFAELYAQGDDSKNLAHLATEHSLAAVLALLKAKGYE